MAGVKRTKRKSSEKYAKRHGYNPGSAPRRRNRTWVPAARRGSG